MDNFSDFKSSRPVFTDLSQQLRVFDAAHLFRGRDSHKCWAQNTLGNQIAFLQNSHHGVGLLFDWHHADSLVLGWVELGAGSWVDRDDLVALHGAFELAKRRFSTFTNLLRRSALYGKASF